VGTGKDPDAVARFPSLALSGLIASRVEKGAEMSEPPPPYGEAAQVHLQPEDVVPERELRRTLAGEDYHDAFAFRPLVREVARLVARAPTPVHIGLFAPWGAGKTTFGHMLEAELRQEPSVAFVRFDAWRGGGESLRRNFLLTATDQLGLSARARAYYEAGLYRARRTGGLDFAALRSTSAQLALLFVVLFIALACVMTLVVGALSILTTEDFAGEIARTMPKLLATSGGAAAVVAGIKILIEAAKVDVTQNPASSEEEFGRLFGELLDDALGSPEHGRKRDAMTERRAQTQRIFFFVDELDRRSPDDILDALTALKTFLGQPRCVFLVAVDREVLEQALVDVLESRPAAVPSGSTLVGARQFIDKLFEHQIVLPTARRRRLSRYAHDLVRDRGGIWADLRRASSLDDTIALLVPTHVSSPRRIKVLLNSFAINMRTAQARGRQDATERWTEIAKLTAIRTEFPEVAEDLLREPRLLSALVRRPRWPSPQLRELLQRYDDPTTSGARTRDDVRRPHPPVMREHLRRYLEKTEGITPKPDLLFLEGAAQAYDPRIGRIGEQIDALAADAPDEASQGLEDCSTEELRALIHLTADMLEDAVGRERSNILKVLLVTAEYLGKEADEYSSDAAAKPLLENYEDLQSEQLPVALQVAASGNSEVARQLLDMLLADSRLWDAGSLSRVARIVAEDLSQEPRAVGLTRIAELVEDDLDFLSVSLNELPGATLRHLDSEQLAVAVKNGLQRCGDGNGDDAMVEAADKPLRPALEELDGRLGMHVLTAVAEVLVNASPHQRIQHVRLRLFAARCALAVSSEMHSALWAPFLVDTRDVFAPRLTIDPQPSPLHVYADALVDALTSADSSSGHEDLIRLWFQLHPPAVQAQELAVAVASSADASTRVFFRDWARRVSPDERLGLVMSLVSQQVRVLADWIIDLADTGEFPQHKLVDALGERIRNSRSDEDQRILLDVLASLAATHVEARGAIDGLVQGMLRPPIYQSGAVLAARIYEVVREYGFIPTRNVLRRIATRTGWLSEFNYDTSGDLHVEFDRSDPSRSHFVVTLPRSSLDPLKPVGGQRHPVRGGHPSFSVRVVIPPRDPAKGVSAEEFEEMVRDLGLENASGDTDA
jgi:hypothetical protein